MLPGSRRRGEGEGGRGREEEYIPYHRRGTEAERLRQESLSRDRAVIRAEEGMDPELPTYRTSSLLAFTDRFLFQQKLRSSEDSYSDNRGVRSLISIR